MGRKQKWRRVRFWPEIRRFQPAKTVGQEPVWLENDEIEALRLADFQGQTQVKAARAMAISQSTFQRVLERARYKVARALVIGCPIFLKGGEEIMNRPGFGRRAGAGFGAGPGGVCVCTNPKCGYKMPHQAGIPCYQQKCPKCGSPMIREEAAQALKQE